MQKNIVFFINLRDFRFLTAVDFLEWSPFNLQNALFSNNLRNRDNKHYMTRSPSRNRSLVMLCGNSSKPSIDSFRLMASVESLNWSTIFLASWWIDCFCSLSLMGNQHWCFGRGAVVDTLIRILSLLLLMMVWKKGKILIEKILRYIYLQCDLQQPELFCDDDAESFWSPPLLLLAIIRGHYY